MNSQMKNRLVAHLQLYKSLKIIKSSSDMVFVASSPITLFYPSPLLVIIIILIYHNDVDNRSILLPSYYHTRMYNGYRHSRIITMKEVPQQQQHARMNGWASEKYLELELASKILKI